MDTGSEADLLRDSKYRAYYAQVEKALKAFENTAEWADLISALGRLNKILSSQVKYSFIPKKVTIGKRLAQCLHPALPSGVHLKALETYNIIFKCIGISNLATDLFIYSSGLFPLLSYAAINVRPHVLQLYESHFVGLQQHIKPALTGLIIALLPGLEEGSEHFDRTNNLLDEFTEAVEPCYFYTCLWECLLTSVPNRLAGLNFILQHFNRKLTTEDQLFMLGTKIDLLVEALISCVSDASALVQRSCLDVLMLCFPTHNSQLPKSDLMRLLTQAILVLLRRDMSLNRRLFAWLFGTDINGLSTSFSAPPTSTSSNQNEEESDMEYFIAYSKQMLIVSIRDILDHFPIKLQLDESQQFEQNITEDVLTSKSFRVLMSLLDRTEIAPLILDDIFIVVMRKAYRCCNNKDFTAQNLIRRNSSLPVKNLTKPTNPESLKTINLFFSSLDRKFVWSFIASLFERCCSKYASNGNDLDSMTLLEYCSIVEFVIDKISLDISTDLQMEHIPVLIINIASCLIRNVNNLDNFELYSCFNLISQILQHIQPTSEVSKMKNNLDSNKLTNVLENSTVTDNISPDYIQSSKVKSNNCGSCISYCQFHSQLSHGKVFYDCIETCMQLFVSTCTHLFVCEEKLIFIVIELLQDKYGDISENLIMQQVEKQASVKECEMVKKLREEVWDKDAVDAVASACRLLVHLSSLPILNSCENIKTVPESLNKFPNWLKILMATCCLVKNSQLRLEMFSCFLDLVGLTKTAVESAQCNSQLNTPIFLNPLLSASCLQTIEHETNFYKLMTSIIWNNLDSNLNDCNKLSSLLNQLHHFVSDPRLCEDVITSSLLSADDNISLESHKKFIQFWHFLNERSKMMPFSSTTKSFDRSLFVVLDGLRCDNPSRSTLIQTFVIQAIQRNDLIRLLEPILLVLHHPNTSRISIQKLQLKETLKKLKEEKLNKPQRIIKGISCIKGRVEYHINDEAIKAKLENRPPKEIFTVAVQNMAGNSWTHKTEDKSNMGEQELSFERINPVNVSLTINPVAGIKEDEDEDDIVYASRQIKNHKKDIKGTENFKRAKRLNRDLCRKEYIYFDDKEVDYDSSEEIVKYILHILLENVEKHSFNKGTYFSNNDYIENISKLVISDENSTIDSSSSEETSDIINEAPDKISSTGQNIAAIIEKLNSHLLVYSNKFDMDKTLYIMIQLSAILSTNLRLVLCALTTSNLGSILIPRSDQLIDLVSQHKKSILCNNLQIFTDTNFLNGTKSCMIIEIVVSILLYYLRGQLFPQKPSDDTKKKKVPTATLR